MKRINLGGTSLSVPRIVVGCMRLNELRPAQIETLIAGALECGANFFDHADIYGRGECESLFAKAIGMNAAKREKMILQSKCDIRPEQQMYDCSKAYLLSAADGILSRLQTDYLDILLLHRPDALMEPEEVAEAFDRLHSTGKVRYFGVSNQNPGQIRLLQKYLPQKLLIDQLQLSITNSTMISSGIHVNMLDDAAVCRDDGVLDYCRLHEITIQAWSPFQYGMFEGTFLQNPKFPELNKTLSELAQKYAVSETTIAAAWVLRHPAKMQLIAGTTKLSRLQEICGATDLTLSREDWYAIYRAAGNTIP